MSNNLEKHYIGHILQLQPEISFWTMDWILDVVMRDLQRELDGWVILQGKARHPIESNGLCFLAAKNYVGAFKSESVKLYFSAFDLGYRQDKNIGRFHVTQLDANFIDSSQTWQTMASEQMVAEALPLLCAFYSAFEPDKPFWRRISGYWVCGRDLFPCPDWVE